MLEPIILPKAPVLESSAPLPSSFLSAFKLVIKPYLTMGKLPISLASEILNMHVRTIGAVWSKKVVYKTLMRRWYWSKYWNCLSNIPDLSITQVERQRWAIPIHLTSLVRLSVKWTWRQTVPKRAQLMSVSNSPISSSTKAISRDPAITTPKWNSSQWLKIPAWTQNYLLSPNGHYQPWMLATSLLSYWMWMSCFCLDYFTEFWLDFLWVSWPMKTSLKPHQHSLVVTESLWEVDATNKRNQGVKWKMQA